MKIPGLIEFNSDLNHNDLVNHKIITLTFTDTHAAQTIPELGLIREIKYYKYLFKEILKDLEIDENDNVILVSPSLKELYFNLAMICAIHNENIEFGDNQMYYTGPLRRNVHISDTAQDFDPIIEEDEDVFYDDELNLENYDVDELED